MMKLWISNEHDTYFLIPKSIELKQGNYKIQNILSKEISVNKQQIDKFLTTKNSALNHLKNELPKIVDTVLKQTSKNLDTQDHKIAALLKPFLTNDLDVSNTSEIENAIGAWIDTNKSKEESVESILSIFTELLPKERAEETEYIQAVQQAIREEDPSGIATFLNHFLETLNNTPDGIHEQLFSRFNFDKKVAKKLKSLPVHHIKNFNRKLAKYVSELAKALQKPLEEIDLDHAVETFESSIYTALRVENPHKQRARKRKEEYNQFAKKSIQDTLKKSKYTSFEEIRKKHNPPKS